MSTYAIEIDGLTKSYDGNVHALDGVDIKIKKGEFFGLLGPNGAGKTTTINILTGLVFKDSGSAKVFSVDWFFPIEKLLYYQAGYYGIKRNEAAPMIDELLERLGLAKKRGSRLRQLSGGMKRRFQIAKALVHDPDIIILDEPTAGVDVELRRDLWQYLRDLHKAGKTILLTTHYIEEAELLCENVAIIDEGKILKEGNPKSLTRELGTAGITVHVSNSDGDLGKYISDYNYTINDNRLYFSVKDPDLELPKIIKLLSDAQVHINSIESSRSSLEDVFLDLTGRGLNS